MKKILFVIVTVLLFMNGYSQSGFWVNVNAGLDNNYYKYYDKTNYTKLEDGGDDYSLGIDVGYSFSDLFRMKVDFEYGKMNYGQNRIGGEPTAEDIISIDQFSFAPRLDFRLLNYKRFDLYLSTGLKFLYNCNSDQKSYLSDGSLSDTEYNYIDTGYEKALTGWIGGAVLKYSITDRLGVTVSPDYTLFFDKLYYKNDENLQRFNLSFGVEWDL